MTIVGTGDLKFELDPDWPRGMPEGWEFTLASGVAVNSRDEVYVFSRGVHPITMWNTDGDFTTSWGEASCLDPADRYNGTFRDPHGIYVGPDDSIWLTDTQTHTVTKHTRLGEKLMELGRRDYANVAVSQTGDHGLPFNMPSGVVINDAGHILVSDGYANRNVHTFTADGELLSSWGRAGQGPAEFGMLHNIGIDNVGRIYIADRPNSRVQILEQDGTFVAEWTDVINPGAFWYGHDGLMYVVEQGEPTGVSVFTLDGDLVSRWRGPENGMEAPHDIWGDSSGNLYIAEIGIEGHGQRVRKYIRQ